MRNTGRTGSRSKSEVERLKRLAAKRVKEGATKREMEEEFDVCRQTLASYLEGLDIDYAAMNAAAIAPFKQKMAGAICQMAQDVLDGVVNPKPAETWRGLMSDLRDMLPGMNAPTTSVTAHIRGDGTSVQYQFLEHSHGLKADQLQEVFKFMDSLPRTSVTIADCFTPQLKEPDEQE